MARKIRKLGQLETHGVSLVTRGANKKTFAIIKSENDVSTTKLLVDVIEKGDMPGDPDEFDKLCKDAGLEGQAAETFKAICKLAGTFGDHEPMKKALKTMLPKMMGFADSDEPKPTTSDADDVDDEEEEDDMADKTEETKKAEEVAKAETERIAKQEADIKASVSAQVAAQVESIMKSQEAVVKSLQEQVAKAEGERRAAVWLQKAEAELKFVPGQTPGEMAILLKSLEDSNPALAESQFKIYKAMSAQMQSITKSRGFTGNAQGTGTQTAQADDAFQAIMKAALPTVEAKVNVVKSLEGVKYEHSGDRITKAAEFQAVNDALVADPSLYDAYLQENPSQTEKTQR